MSKITHAVLILLFFLICGCAATEADNLAPVTVDRESTLAVWDLEDLSLQESARPDLGQFLSARILEVVKEAGYTIVERERLLLALKELKLGSSSLADSPTRLRIGRLMGSRLMIFGAYQVIEGRMRVDLRMVEVETGRILKTAQKTTESGALTDWLMAVEKAARELI
jgi:curli production assembly/transport component CsgG